MYIAEKNTHTEDGQNMLKNNTKVGLLQDLHIGVRGSSVFRNYIKSYLIDYAMPYFHSQGITQILQGGDLMDSRVRLLAKDRGWMVKELIPKLKEFGMTWHVLSGNHDIGNLDDLELSWVDWIAAESDGCIVSYNKPQDLEIMSTTFSMIPWICKANYDETLDYIENTDATVAIMHAELAGFKMAKGNLCKKGTIDQGLLSRYENVYSSHFHQESRAGNIHYLGMNYHTDWGSVESDPVKGLYTYDTLTGVLDFKENPVGMSLFTELNYNYQEIAASRKGKLWNDVDYLENELNLKDKVIRIIITDRSNAKHYASFVKALRSVQCINYTIIDTTQSIELEAEEVDAKDFKVSPIEILLDKINTIEYSDCDDDKEIRYEAIGNKLKSVYNRCQEESNLV